MLVKRRRFIFIATFIIIAAVAIALCVGFLRQSPVEQYDGTLVQTAYQNDML